MRLLVILGRTAVFLAAGSFGYGLRRIAAGRPAALAYVGRKLCRHVETLGPTFIKLGQLLATRRDLAPEELLAPLQKLHQQAAPVPFAAIRSVLLREYGSQLEEIFLSIDPAPIGTGAVAQVHCAVTRDGRPVALKVLKPFAAEVLRNDTGIVRAFAALASCLPGLRDVPVREVMRELTSILLAQSDLEREADYNRRFRAAFRYVERIRFPSLAEDLCRPSVLAMEHLRPLARLDTLTAEPERKQRLALLGLRALYRMIFDHGLVHADMHPGNVLQTSGDQLVLLDYGLTAAVSEETRARFVDFFFAVASNRGHDAAELLWRTASDRRDEAGWPAFEAAMIGFVSCEAVKTSGEFSVTGFVHELLDIQRRHGVRSSPEFIGLVLAMTVYDGVCRMLYPGCDFQAEARGYLIAARYNRTATLRALTAECSSRLIPRPD